MALLVEHANRPVLQTLGLAAERSGWAAIHLSDYGAYRPF
jgi:hypothetical protein